MFPAAKMELELDPAGDTMFVDMIHAKKPLFCARCKIKMIVLDKHDYKCNSCGMVYRED